MQPGLEERPIIGSATKLCRLAELTQRQLVQCKVGVAAGRRWPLTWQVWPRADMTPWHVSNDVT